MVAVAQQVEHRIVTPEVAGSRPVGHPKNKNTAYSSKESGYEGYKILIFRIKI